MNNQNVKVFAIESTLSSFPSYVICGANVIDEEKIHGESFLLAIFKGRKARLVAMEVAMPSKMVDLQIDTAFVIDECLTQAKFNLLDIGKTRIQRYGSGDLPFIHKTVEIDRGYLFHSFFVQEEIKNKFELIAKISKIDAVKHLMNQLNHCEKFSFVPMNV